MKNTMIAVCICSMSTFAACKKSAAPAPNLDPDPESTPRAPALRVAAPQMKSEGEPTAGQYYRTFNGVAQKFLDAKRAPENIGPALEEVRTEFAKLKKFTEANPHVIGTFKSYVEQAEKFEAQAILVAAEVKASPDNKTPTRNASGLLSRYNTLAQLGGLLNQLEANGRLK